VVVAHARPYRGARSWHAAQRSRRYCCFSPVQADNLRIDGLYFDQVSSSATPPVRIIRSQAVHVGIAAQGYLFPAPTGVVDYRLRTPGDAAVFSALIGNATYGEDYGEFDFQAPIERNVLSMGGGIGYTRNNAYDFARQSVEWTGGWVARWQPMSSLLITPFWGLTNHKEYGEKTGDAFIGDDGYPRYRQVSTQSEPWAYWTAIYDTFGTTARWSFSNDWLLAAGVFRSLVYSQGNTLPLLLDVNAAGRGELAVLQQPPNGSGSTSGEVRLSRSFVLGPLRNTLYARITGRDSSIESGGLQTPDLGPASTSAIPPIAQPVFHFPPNTDVHVHQLTPGIAYAGLWPNVGQLTLSAQKVSYHRTVMAPDTPVTSDTSSPGLFNAAAATFLTPRLVAYGSYTRGFEEIGIAPLNAVNRYLPVPAQETSQVDGGIRYQLLPKLQLVAGVFEIDKPYFNLDLNDVFRHVGKTSNRGAELSVTGDVNDRFNVVLGLVLINPKVQYQAGAVVGPTNVVAIGPIPGYMSSYFQYHPAALPGVILGATIQTTSSRYAVYPNINLPAVTTLGFDVHYKTKLFGNNATFWLESYNLTDAYGLTPSASGQLTSFDARRYELSLVVDL
jgi:iron complex outermembrane recepter protein